MINLDSNMSSHLLDIGKFQYKHSFIELCFRKCTMSMLVAMQGFKIFIRVFDQNIVVWLSFKSLISSEFDSKS